MPVKMKRRSSVISQGKATPVTVIRGVRGRRSGVHAQLERAMRPLDLALHPHPETGAVYIVAMPQWLPPLEEIRKAWLLNQTPWLRVIDIRQLRAAMDRYRGERAVFTIWNHDRIPQMPSDRRALVVPVYYEVVDRDLSKLLPGHRAEIQNFSRRAREFDGIFVHTPRSAEVMRELTAGRVGVLPAGCDPRVLGRPLFDAPKTLDACWYGLVAGGRRGELFRGLSDPSIRSADVGGVFGRDLVARLQGSKTVIYFKHTDIDFCSTWRIWQAMSSSAAMIQEEGDAWPLGDEHCYRIPRVTAASVADVVRFVRDLPATEALQRARDAHEALSAYTTKRCIEEFVVAGTAEWLR